MNMNIPDLNHSFSLITERGITRTYRSKLVQELLASLQSFSLELCKTHAVGHVTTIDTNPCRVTLEVVAGNMVSITFTGDDEKTQPVHLDANGVIIKLNGFPVANNTIISLISSLLLKNTQEDNSISIN